MNSVKLLLSALATVVLFTPVAFAQSYNARIDTPRGGCAYIRSLQTYEPIECLSDETPIEVAECGHYISPHGEYCRVTWHRDPDRHHYLEGLVYREYIY